MRERERGRGEKGREGERERGREGERERGREGERERRREGEREREWATESGCTVQCVAKHDTVRD